MAPVNGTTEFTLQYRLDDAVNKLSGLNLSGDNRMLMDDAFRFESAGRIWRLQLEAFQKENKHWLDVWVNSNRTISSGNVVVALCTHRILSSVEVEAEFSEELFWCTCDLTSCDHREYVAMLSVLPGEGSTPLHVTRSRALEISQLLDPAFGYIHDDGAITFEVTVKIKAINGVLMPTARSFSFYEYSETKRSALDGPPSDFDVIANDGTRFGCHIFVLKENSVFRNVYIKLTKSNLSDAEKHGEASINGFASEVTLVHMSADVVRVVLSHIYHGSVKFDVSIAGYVLHAAETNDLPLLKRKCEAVMAQNISQDNIIDYFLLSEMTDAPRLKTDCLSFIKKNFTTFQRSEKWKNFIKSAGTDIKTVNLINYMLEAGLSALDKL